MAEIWATSLLDRVEIDVDDAIQIAGRYLKIAHLFPQE